MDGQAAEIRRAWRGRNGSVDIKTPDVVISVDVSTDGEQAAVSVTVVDQWTSLSRQLVAEMMVMAGEAIASFGKSLPIESTELCSGKTRTGELGAETERSHRLRTCRRTGKSQACRRASPFACQPCDQSTSNKAAFKPFKPLGVNKSIEMHWSLSRPFTCGEPHTSAICVQV